MTDSEWVEWLWGMREPMSDPNQTPNPDETPQERREREDRERQQREGGKPGQTQRQS
jgi:hypothetical protein